MKSWRLRPEKCLCGRKEPIRAPGHLHPPSGCLEEKLLASKAQRPWSPTRLRLCSSSFHTLFQVNQEPLNELLLAPNFVFGGLL